VSNLVFIGVGGAVGAILRYLVDQIAIHNFGSTLLGTFAVNISGSFVLGVLVGLFYSHPDWPVEIRLFLAIGILGSYTTFSTFSVATIQSLQSGQILAAGISLLGNIVIGLTVAYIGLMVGKSIY
jgi:CrcB protein